MRAGISEKREKKRRTKRNVSIRWKLAVYMALFILAVVLFTWLFQIILLDYFYEMVRRDELRSCVGKISESVNSSEEMEEICFDCAAEYSMRIQVYAMSSPTGNSPVCFIDYDATGGMAPDLRPTELEMLYRDAENHKGMYIAKQTFGGYEFYSDFFGFFRDQRVHFPKRAGGEDVRLICAGLAQTETGEVIMIVVNAAMRPLASTVHTLEILFVWSFILLAAIALLMTFLLYRRITKPLIQMNRAAKLLAQGKYDVEFSGEGYRETRELADTLNYASRELSRTDRLQKELIANVSHDLRTPLTMIKGYGEVMRDIPGENTPENAQVIVDETARLSELVNDLLDLSRIQSGVSKPVSEPFDLTAAVREVLERYDTLIRHKGYQIRFVSEENAWVRADRKLILQVLYNLINNAVNYTGEDQTVTVVQSVAGTYVRVSVIDTGEGIAEDQLPLIWERYYKVDKVHRRATVGTGIGLSIVKGILELHGAEYGVQSKVGEGSTFWFELPVVETTDPEMEE